MAETYLQNLPELPVIHRPLGRHIMHDPRSRDFAIEAEAEPGTVRWERRAPVFDQGSVGSCTGNAMAGAIGTDSKGREGTPTANEELAVKIYSLATHLDHIQGIFPPYDTGSTGLAVCKAAKKMELITGYRHAFSLKAALTALQNGPIIVGLSWLSGMDEPDADGIVRFKGYMRGGHEFEGVGYDADTGLLEFVNSWGTSYGKEGHFFMHKEEFGIALRQGGDVKQPTYL